MQSVKQLREISTVGPMQIVTAYMQATSALTFVKNGDRI